MAAAAQEEQGEEGGGSPQGVAGDSSPGPLPGLPGVRIDNADEEVFAVYVELECLAAERPAGRLRRGVLKNEVALPGRLRCYGPWTVEVCFVVDDIRRCTCEPHGAVLSAQDAAHLDFEVAGRSIHLRQNRQLNAQAGQTGGALWDASLVLTRFLEHYRDALGVAQARILELGAGCGLCGLACAAALGARQVVLTDQHPVTELLERNLRANGLLDERGGGGDGAGAGSASVATVSELTWGSRDKRDMALVGRRWDLVLAADCVFNTAHVEALVATLREAAWTNRAAAKVLVCSELRDPLVWETFLRALLGAFRTVWRLDPAPAFADGSGARGGGARRSAPREPRPDAVVVVLAMDPLPPPPLAEAGARKR